MFGSGPDVIYCGPAPVPGDLLARWNLDPVVLAGLVLLAVAFRRSRPGTAGVLVLAVAFVSPLCALSSALFSARVVHHVLLVAVAAPLLAAAMPARRAAPAAFLLVLSTVTLWVWHMPGAYDAALSNVAIYWAMQLTLLGTATAFWSAVLNGDAPPVRGVLLILAAFMQMGFLGAILTFAPGPLYAAHLAAPIAWGLSPLADQQLGGLIMWVPAGLPYAIFAARPARRAWRGGAAA